MIYESQVPKVEATLFELAGAEFYGVAVDGRAHAVTAEIFRLFFRPVPPSAPVESVAVTNPTTAAVVGVIRQQARRGPGKPSATPPRAAATAVGSSDMTTGQAVRHAVLEQPRTTAETVDRVCVILGWDLHDKDARGRVAATISYQVKQGKLEKRDDPKTQLPALYVTGGAE